MQLKNTNQNELQGLYNNNKKVIYASLVPYKNNTCIKVYDEEGNPIGDIPEENINTYINEKSIVLFLNQSIDDDTGLPVYILETIV